MSLSLPSSPVITRGGIDQCASNPSTPKKIYINNNNKNDPFAYESFKSNNISVDENHFSSALSLTNSNKKNSRKSNKNNNYKTKNTEVDNGSCIKGTESLPSAILNSTIINTNTSITDNGNKNKKPSSIFTSLFRWSSKYNKQNNVSPNNNNNNNSNQHGSNIIKSKTSQSVNIEDRSHINSSNNIEGNKITEANSKYSNNSKFSKVKGKEKGRIKSSSHSYDNCMFPTKQNNTNKINYNKNINNDVKNKNKNKNNNDVDNGNIHRYSNNENNSNNNQSEVHRENVVEALERTKGNVIKLDSIKSLKDEPLNNYIFQFDDFTDIQQIGKGAFAEVYLCKHVPTDQYVVVKEINRRRSGLHETNRLLQNKKKSAKSHQSTSMEEEILNSLSHNDVPFITHCYGSFKDEDNIYYVMEYYPGGELYSYIQANPCFAEDHARFYAAEVLLALHYMHDKLHIAYRDIKPENILLDKDGHICLCDFGHAKRMKQGEKTYTLCGTPDYSAPELLEEKVHDMCVDIWAFGVLVYEMLCGITPFHSPNRSELCSNILKCKVDYPSAVSPIAKDLLSKLIVKNPQRRLGVRGIVDIMKHPWFDPINWNDIRNKRVQAPYIPKTKSAEDASYYTLELSSDNLETFIFPGCDYDYKLSSANA